MLIGMGVLWLVLTHLIDHEVATTLAAARTDQEQAVAAGLQGEVDLVAALVDNLRTRGVSQEDALSELDALRFGENHAYIWLHSFDPKSPDRPTMLMHPTLPQLDGTDISSVLDTDTSRTIDGLSSESSPQASAVSASAEEISRNLDEVNAALQQMASSISEIAQHISGMARSLARTAESASGALEAGTEVAEKSRELKDLMARSRY